MPPVGYATLLALVSLWYHSGGTYIRRGGESKMPRQKSGKED